MRKKRELLEHHRHLFLTRFTKAFFRKLHHVFTLDKNFAGSRLDQAVKVADQGRLTRARKPHNHRNLARLHIDVDVIQTQHMFMLRQQIVFAHAVLDMLQHFSVACAEDFVEPTKANHWLCHDQGPLVFHVGHIDPRQCSFGHTIQNDRKQNDADTSHNAHTQFKVSDAAQNVHA